MKLLIKAVLSLMFIFTLTLILIKFSGLLTIEDIKNFLEGLKEKPAYILGSFIVLLLFIDLFIAVPTMTIIALAGYFLGFTNGLIFCTIGLFLASFTGYFLSKKYGEVFLNKLSSDKKQKRHMRKIFNRHGLFVIVLSRALPMLPEISACLSGLCKIPLYKYFFAWFLGTIPYVSLIVYAGSLSDLHNPMPAIFAVLFITALFSLIWFVFTKYNKSKVKRNRT